MIYDKLRKQFTIAGRVVTTTDPWFIHLLRMRRSGIVPPTSVELNAGKELYALRTEPSGEFHIAPKGGGLSVTVDEDMPVLYDVLLAHFKCGSTIGQVTLVAIYVSLSQEKTKCATSSRL